MYVQSSFNPRSILVQSSFNPRSILVQSSFDPRSNTLRTAPPAPPSHLNLYLSSVSALTFTSPAHAPLLYHFRTSFVPNPFPSISLRLDHLHVFTKKHPGYVLRPRFLHTQKPPPQLRLSPIPPSLTSHLLLTPLPTSLTKKFSAPRALLHSVPGSNSERHTKPEPSELHQSPTRNPRHHSRIPALSDH